MRLSGLRIFGFKTFAAPTTLAFDSGITAIVGPNGSGKSNLVDAIRWVLGEQSSKSLRSSKTDDVIFAGNERRKALGMAEVTLTFDNGEGTQDLPFKEIQLTRRAYRGGDVEYYLNKERVRLRDVHELLMGTGLGPGSYAIVSQGQIDAILVSKPSDRRALFEETSGINKFLARKAEALRRLEGTNANVVRLNDLLREVEARVPELDTQVRRAKRYRSTSARVRELEILSALRSTQSRRAALEAARRDASVNEEAQVAAVAFAERSEAELAAARERLVELERAFESTRGAHETARLDLVSAERDAAAAKSRLETLARQFDREHQNARRRDEDRESLTERLARIDAELEPLRDRTATLAEAEQQASIAVAACRVQVEAAFTALRDFERDGNARAAEYARLRAQAESAERDRARAQADLERSASEVAEVEQLHRDAVRRADETDAEIATCDASLRDAEAEAARREERAAETAAEVPQAQERLRKTTAELAALEARLHTLDELDANLEGHVPGTRAIIDAKTRGNVHGIIGVVSSLIRVDERYARALDVAFGAGVSNIVAEHSSAAEAAIDYLRSRELGRATFLPLDLVGSRTGKELGRLSRIDGVIAYAHELVEVEERYRGVVAFLVGRTLVVDSMRTGVRLAREEQLRDSIVTLEGDQLMGGGAMSGGRSRSGERSILARRAQARSLREETLPALREAVIDGEADLAKAAGDAQRAAAVRDEARRTLATLGGKRKELQAQVSSHRSAAAQSESRLAQLRKRSAEAGSLVASAAAKLSEIVVPDEVHQQASQSERARYDGELAAARSAVEAAEQTLRQARADAASSRERLAALVAEAAAVRTQFASIDADGERLRRMRETSEAEISALRESEAATTTQLAALADAVQTAAAQAKEAQRLRDEAAGAIGTHEKQAAAARVRERELFSAGEAGRRRVAELEAELGMLEDAAANQAVGEEERADVAERYRDVPDSVIDDLPRLRDDLARLSNVNLNAESDRDELTARQTELATQLEDLAKARELLLSGIAELDASCESQFLQTFETVRDAFGAAYGELFPGGEAKMWLTDPENVNSSGVEISVKPPGKKMTSLAALSGGERAMTAAALIFALIRVKPSPFYLLDEIDAALDEMNVERFSTMVRNLATDAQLLIVTHNKKTMELAQRMYGITMAEAGVSSVVTASLEREPAVV